MLHQHALTIVFTAFILLFSVTSHAADPIGEIFQLEGQCSIIRDGQTAITKQGATVHLNDKITTNLQSKLTIRFVDDTQLLLGPLSSATIDTYIYPGPDSSLLFKFSTGTFRAITGKIVKHNPEGFNMETPLSTLGIRGSDIYALVGMIGEEAGALDLGPGHTLEISTQKQTVKISTPGLRSRISSTGDISPPAPIPPSTINQLKKLGTPSSAPKNRSKTTVPNIPSTPTTTRIIVTPPPSSPKPSRSPRYH